MKLSREEVLQIASLARLELTESEIKNYGNQLSDILAHFTSLQNVDTSSVPETTSSLKSELPFREDELSPFHSIEKILKIAPQVSDNQFVVPAIFETPSSTNPSQGSDHEHDA